MARFRILVVCSLTAFALAQEPVDSLPSFTWTSCPANSSCVSQSSSLTIDASWRRIYSTADNNHNCFHGNSWNASLCPDNKSCVKNCGIDSVSLGDYEKIYGVRSRNKSGIGELSLRFVTKGEYGTNYGSRLYLFKTDQGSYEPFNPLNKEISFDVDVSTLPCGVVGSISIHDMDLDGQKSKFADDVKERFGAKYGTGYCEGACPRGLPFINGEANAEGWKPSNVDPVKGAGERGSCCSHVDMFSGNSQATSMALHPCRIANMTACRGTSCAALCDAVGCEFNPYRMNQRDFFGPGKVINTKKKFTVTTRFLSQGSRLSEIKRLYVQDGVTFENVESRVPKINGSSLVRPFCQAQQGIFERNGHFDQNGGMSVLTRSMEGGMVLAISLTDDLETGNQWLDGKWPKNANASAPGAVRGECPEWYNRNDRVDPDGPNPQLVVSNLKITDIINKRA